MDKHCRARFIVETLTKAGYLAYYAGGWVRDFLLGVPSDDIDIATSAPPDVVQSLFPHTVPIGISFGIVLVLIDDHPYEVATFRQDVEHFDGRRPAKIAFSSAKEDAKRRDFTINGMFYDPLKEEVLDFVGGREDLKARILRAIGDPHERMREDYLRMIRAVRLACRLRFTIEEKTQAAIRAHARDLLPSVAIERIMQEMEKARSFGPLHHFFLQLHSFHLLSPLFPELEEISFETFQERIAPMETYPKDLPLVAYFYALFPSLSEKEFLLLCKKLKRTRREEQFISYFFRLKTAVEAEESSLERADWAELYAHTFSDGALQIFASHAPCHATFCKLHSDRVEELSFFIEKIREKKGILEAKHLLELGVSPGERMGNLLKEAERTAINENIRHRDLLIKRLKEKGAL